MSGAVLEGRSSEGHATSDEARRAALARQDGLLKPPGALGALEALAVHYASVRGHLAAPEPPRFGLGVFAADHGVTVEGVSAYPRDVTKGMVGAIVGGVAAVSVLARAHGVELSVSTSVSTARTTSPRRRTRRATRGGRSGAARATCVSSPR